MYKYPSFYIYKCIHIYIYYIKYYIYIWTYPILSSYLFYPPGNPAWLYKKEGVVFVVILVWGKVRQIHWENYSKARAFGTPFLFMRQTHISPNKCIYQYCIYIYNYIHIYIWYRFCPRYICMCIYRYLLKYMYLCVRMKRQIDKNLYRHKKRI